MFAPVLMRAILPTRPVESDVRQRLLRLAGEHQVKLRDIRCLDTGPERAANAMVMGLLPRFRYVLITDSLLRELEPDEIDAIVAHELGHSRRHHLLIKIGAALVGWLPAVGVVAAAAAVGPDALRRGLEKLAAANAIKRRTGRMWNLLTQHPGLEQRIEQLRTVSPTGA